MKELKSTHAKIFYFEIAIDTVFGSFAAVATFFVPPNGATSVEISRSFEGFRDTLHATDIAAEKKAGTPNSVSFARRIASCSVLSLKIGAPGSNVSSPDCRRRAFAR